MSQYGPHDPYGQPLPQQPPNPYGQRYAPQQPMHPPSRPGPGQPMYEPVSHAAPRRSQGLAITTLALGLVAVVLAATTLRGIGLIAGLVAAVLAVVAMAAKSQGGTKFAIAGLVLAMLSLPVAFLMWTWATESAKTNVEQQRLMQKCAAEEPDTFFECAGLN